MKKIIALVLCFALALCFVGCGLVGNDDAETQQIRPAVEIIDNETLAEILSENAVVPENTQTPIEIEIKPLGEKDEVTLAEAAQNNGFENVKLFEAFANAIDKEPEDVTQEDIDLVHYVAVGPESDDMYTVYIGHINYVDLCLSDTDPDQLMTKLNEVVMISEFSYDSETDVLSDLGNFKNVEMFEIYNVNISDVSFIKQYNSLIFGYFKNNGIEDVSCLADYNPESLHELDFTDNKISDWSPLEHIKEKVIVFYGVSDGMPVTITLENKLAQDAAKQESAKDTDEAEEKGEETEIIETEPEAEFEIPEFLDENGEKVDFGSLFD